MQGFIDVICAIVASLAAAAFAQFGVTLQTHGHAAPASQEVRRTAHPEAPRSSAAPDCRPPALCFHNAPPRS
jgi:hypothetical protein